MNNHILRGLDKFTILNEVSNLLGMSVSDFLELTTTQIIDFLDNLHPSNRFLMLDIKDGVLKVMEDRVDLYLGNITLSELFYAIPHPKKREKIAVLAVLYAITSGKLSTEMSKKIYS